MINSNENVVVINYIENYNKTRMKPKLSKKSPKTINNMYFVKKIIESREPSSLSFSTVSKRILGKCKF